jgi:abequosyltransferase
MYNSIENEYGGKIKLSVAIPTYNGAKYIREAIDCILIQLDDINGEVEIVISDNASTDQTPEIIRDYQKKYPFIKYFCNEENLGMDRNFDLAVKRSTGEYVWLFSDNDKMSPCAISKVLKVIHSYNDLAVIVVNYCIFDEKLGKNITDRVVNENKDIFFESADDFWDKLDILSALISVNIVRKSLWNESNVKNFYFTNWVHVGAIISILAGRKSYFVSTPYVRINSGPAKWEKGGNGLKYAMVLEDIVSTMDKFGYKKYTSEKILNSFFERLPDTIICARNNGLVVSLELLRNMYSRYGNHPSFWLKDLPLLLLPTQIYNSKIIRLVYRKVKKCYCKVFLYVSL